MIKTHRRNLAAVLWISSVQYFLIQYLVAEAWGGSYSLKDNPISDLGNSACGVFGGRLVCSPLHWWMNLSFITLGVTMIAGAWLLTRNKSLKTPVRTGLYCLMAAGLGTVIVGLVPENSTLADLHGVGAGLAFVLGNLGLILIGAHIKTPRWLGYLSLALGGVGLVGLVMYVNSWYLGLGNGGMERFVAYPQTIWLIVCGVRSRFKHDVPIAALAD